MKIDSTFYYAYSLNCDCTQVSDYDVKKKKDYIEIIFLILMFYCSNIKQL